MAALTIWYGDLNDYSDKQNPAQHYQHCSNCVEPQGYVGFGLRRFQEPIPVIFLSLHGNHDNMQYTKEQGYVQVWQTNFKQHFGQQDSLATAK